MADLDPIQQGDDETLSITVTNPDGTPYNLTGLPLRFVAKRSLLLRDDQGEIVKTIGSGITVTNAAGGLAEVAIAGSDTRAINAPAFLYWDLQIKQGGKNYTLAKGRVPVLADVGKEPAA